jgi:Ca2+-binding RTX toxin-like protein
VDNNWLDHNAGDNSEQLFMAFSNTATSAPYAMTAAEITTNSLGVDEEAVWHLYNTNGHTSDEFKADPSLWELVNEGTDTGSANSQSTFIVDGGVDSVTGDPITFDAIVLEAGNGDAYRVFDVTTFTTDSGANTSISYYNGTSVTVSDADGDNNFVSPAFEITFDADGNISGTSSHEIIAGSSGSDFINGGEGNDVISGGDGNDMLDGGLGDDHLTGGSGADTFKVAQGNDTITDYSQTDGDVVDIGHVYEPGDHLEVSANPDGTANLSILDSSNNLLGSVSFDTIDFVDLDATPDVDINGDGDMNQLDSLLGQVDVDDGIA